MLRTVCFMLLLLAGCTAAPGPGADAPAVPSEWSECRWSLPDGEPLPCDGTTVALEGVPRNPLWVCNHRQDSLDGGHFSLLRSPAGDEHAVVYDEGKWPVTGGTFAVWDENGFHTYNWSQEDANVMLPLGRAFEPTGKMAVLLYRAWIETDDPRMINASLRQAVTWWDEEPFAVHHMDTDAGSFLFYERRTLMFSESSFSSFSVQDNGYNTTIFVKPSYGASYDWALLGAPNPDCVNDRPVPLQVSSR